VKLADEVQKMFCRFFIKPVERQALVNALIAFGEATGTKVHYFTEIRQGIYVASAKANEMKRGGDGSGVKARDGLFYVLRLVRYGLVDAEVQAGGTDEEWPDLISDESF
jgi:hypothetical protein